MDETEAAAVSDSLILKQETRNFTEHEIQTKHGLRLTVYVVGDRRKPAIITYHDLGLNAISCFQTFFQFSEMSVIGDKYCVYHVNAPGQEEDAAPIPDKMCSPPPIVFCCLVKILLKTLPTAYPSIDGLAEMIGAVVTEFKLKTFLGFGVGAGANILCRYALKYPKVVDGLILVNCSAGTPGWVEWGYQKANIYYLRNKGMTNLTVDYLMWHNFGRNLDDVGPDLIQSYRQYFSKLKNPRNLAAFIESYAKQPVLLIVGAGSPHTSDGVEMNTKLNPTRANWMKISECSGLVLEEKPDKVAEAILLFVQGLGHFPTVSHLKWRQSRSGSICSMRSNSICVPDMSSVHRESIVKHSPIRESVSEENILCEK